MEIKYVHPAQVLCRTRLGTLKKKNESIRIDPVYGSGQGDVARQLEQMEKQFLLTNRAVTNLIECTIAFLDQYDASMNKADNTAAAEIRKGGES